MTNESLTDPYTDKIISRAYPFTGTSVGTGNTSGRCQIRSSGTSNSTRFATYGRRLLNRTSVSLTASTSHRAAITSNARCVRQARQAPYEPPARPSHAGAQTHHSLHTLNAPIRQTTASHRQETRKRNARHRGTALFLALLAAAIITGTSTTAHNGATLLALILLAAALAVGIRLAALEARATDTTTTEPNTTALDEGAAR